MGQIIKPVCLCPCVRLRALSRSHFLMDFHPNWHRRKNPKVKTSSLGVNIALTIPPFCTQTPILGEEVFKIHANINNNPIIALNVGLRESPKFPRFTRNRDRGTGWWRQTLDRKWKYSRFAHAQWKICNIILTIYYGNSSVVVDLLWDRYHVPYNVFLVHKCFTSRDAVNL